MSKELELKGVIIKDILHFPPMPNPGCLCGRPTTDLVQQASEKHGLDIAGSFVIGNGMMDIEMAHRVGAIDLLVSGAGGKVDIENEIEGFVGEAGFQGMCFP